MPPCTSSARRAAAAVLAVRPDPEADAAFVGRSQELAQLLGLLAAKTSAASTPTADSAAAGEGEDIGNGGPGGVVVSAVAGAPGVGKTALAQAAARAAVAQGWFPGGAVTVDLHGYDPDPDQVVWPAQLYAGLLRALGVPGEQIPPTEVEQATAYHQVLDQLAGAGRPVLMVLDNVGDADQVADVLPRGAGGHRVLITSRDSMARLPQARLVDLHVLQPAEAVDLLAAGLYRRDRADRRVAADPAAAAQLVELCGQLPLAVQIVAALLADEPDRPLSEMVIDLTDEGHRLAGLDYDGRWAVRAAFDLSYRRLDPAIADLFGWLAAVPGPDVGLAVAAAVADRNEPTTRAGLRALCRAHLLDQQSVSQPRQRPRWRMHDLIRLYAAEHLTPDQHTAGFDRVLAHYRHTADLAVRPFIALAADQDEVLAEFSTPQDAMAWVLAERAGLVACIVHAAGTHPNDTVRLAEAVAPLLERTRLLADWVTVASAAVQAADALDRNAAADTWNELGLALHYVRRFDEAIAALQQARDISRELGDRRGEGSASDNLGIALVEARRFDEAITAHQQARDISREVGDRRGEGIACGNLGVALAEARRFDEAITCHQQAGDISREIGDRHAEGRAWGNMGAALQQLRRFDEAITAHRHAGDIYREVGDRHGEGQTWNNIGAAQADLRQFDEAITALQHAGDIDREIGDRHSEGQTWGNLGLVLAEMRRFDEAITAHQQACDIHREVGDRHGEGTAWTNLGLTLAEVQRFDEAITAHRHAGDIYRDVGNRHGEGTAWGNLGLALAKARRFDEAIDAYQRSIAMYEESADQYGQAQALENLGAAHAELGQAEKARRAWTDAVELYAVAGAEDDADRIRQAIANLDP